MNRPNRLTTLILCGCLLATVGSIGHAQTTSSETKTSIGVVDCGTWLKERKGNKTVTYAGVWVNGYLSGVNLLSGKGNDFLANVKNTEQLHLWIDNYCRQNPLKDVEDAAVSLMIELIESK